MQGESSEALLAKFREFDTDGNGSISEEEFGNLVAALGLRLTAGEIQIAYTAIDINGNGRIDFGEFKQWWAKR
jgi:Ca2+-binding EF-hand superfamily protein